MSESERPNEGHDYKKLVRRLVLVVGLVVIAIFFMPALPRDQILTFRFDLARPVKSLTASFTREGEREPRTGVTLRFPNAAGPTVRHELRLPNGRYDIAIEVEREAPDGALEETRFERRVNLEGGETILPLKDAE